MDSFVEYFQRIRSIDPADLNNIDVLNFFVSASSLFVSTLSLGVALIALIYAWIQFLSKSGMDFHGIFATSTSIWSRQRYISEIILENKKDKSIAISYIYLRAGRNIYIELADYNSSPRIISPFETIKIKSDEGVSGYISSDYKIDLHSILGDRKIKKCLMVVTPQGVSKVKGYKSYWNIYVESLRNHFIIPVRPVKKYYNGKEYADDLQFVVIDELGGERFLYRNSVFSTDTVSLKVDNFTNPDDLKSFLDLSLDNNSSRIRVVRVGYNFKDFENYSDASVSADGYIKTIIIGKLYTYFQTLKYKFNKFSNKLKKLMGKVFCR